MERVMVYIDGFNLYFGLRSKGWRKYYWLNLVALASALLKPAQKLEGVHYFTSRIRSNGNNLADIQRQTTYLEALETLPGLTLHFGHYLEKSKKCIRCGAKWVDFEEKMTDVNIAVQLLDEAFDDLYDTALIISGDSDLEKSVRRIRGRFKEKRVVVAFPPDRHSFVLKQSANAYFTIGEANLRKSQLPPSLQRTDGYILRRPTHWSQVR